MPGVTLLGPQRRNPNLVESVDRLGIDGRVAAITAGWQERELEDDELRAHLRRPVVNLRLHWRSEQAFEADPDLFKAHRARQDRLRALQRIYRYRLDFFLEPARELLRRTGDPTVLDPARDSAIEAIRRLDQEQLEQIREVHREFERRHAPRQRPSVMQHRMEIADILGGCAAVAIAGGHVAVLINRMRIFGVDELFADLPIFAWSAGAMALSERIVLFHDSPPQGAGNPEVLDEGLCRFRGLVPLPHAETRLRLEDPARVELFARRFAPAICVPLHGDAHLDWDGEAWIPGGGARRLTEDGRVVAMKAQRPAPVLV